jgi:IstB-like ATP binding protein
VLLKRCAGACLGGGGDLNERKGGPGVGDRSAAVQPLISGWTKTFTDPRLCAAIVDRLTFAGQIIETGTTSYRLAHARKRRAAG